MEINNKYISTETFRNFSSVCLQESLLLIWQHIYIYIYIYIYTYIYCSYYLLLEFVTQFLLSLNFYCR